MMAVPLRRIGVVAVLSGCGRLGFDMTAPGDAVGPADASAGVSPIAWWHLDEAGGTTAVDSISGFVGVLVDGSSGPATWTTGHTGGGLRFTGNGDAVAMGSPAPFANLAALTISEWVKPTSITAAGGPHCMTDKGSPDSGWAVLANQSSNGDIGFGAPHGTDDTVRLSGAGALVIGQWTHVVVTWDGGPAASSVHVYRDGVEVAYATSIDSQMPRPDDATIGFSINCGATSGFAGTIDEVQLFDRALTPAQVAALP